MKKKSLILSMMNCLSFVEFPITQDKVGCCKMFCISW